MSKRTPEETCVYQVKDQMVGGVPVWLFWNVWTQELCQDPEGNQPVGGHVSVNEQDGWREITLENGSQTSTYYIEGGSAQVSLGLGRKAEGRQKRQPEQKDERRATRYNGNSAHRWNGG